MTPDELSAVVLVAVRDCLAAGEFTGAEPAEVVVERPKNPEHGD
jgi:arginyl-tRNA synthetase